LRNALSNVDKADRNKDDVNTGQGPTIELNGSFRASKIFIGILEGTDVNDLAAFPDLYGELATSFRQQEASPAVFRETLVMADFYGIHLYERLMAETLMQISRKGHLYALTAFVVAVEINNDSLAKMAVIQMDNLSDMRYLGLPLAKEMGVEAYWQLTRAFVDCMGRPSIGCGSLADKVRFDRVWSVVTPTSLLSSAD
jgi:hypothetical protein